MKANEFLAAYYSAANSESEVKALWSELVNMSVDAMNMRIDELKNPGKAKVKAASRKAGQENVVDAAIQTGKLVIGGVPTKTVDLAEEKIDARSNRRAGKSKAEKVAMPEKPKAEKKAVAKAEKKGKAEKKDAYSMKVVKLTAAEKKAVKEANLQFIDYTDKAFAFIGNTKPVAKILSKLNGRFNHGLSCGAGWVFAKANKDAVLKSLGME